MIFSPILPSSTVMVSWLHVGLELKEYKESTGKRERNSIKKDYALLSVCLSLLRPYFVSQMASPNKAITPAPSFPTVLYVVPGEYSHKV
jgi:hypothetical protein